MNLSIVVAVKGDDITSEVFKEPAAAVAKYQELRHDLEYDFVGCLRGPRWYKRATPKRAKQSEEVTKRFLSKKAEQKAERDAAMELERAKDFLAAAQQLHDHAIEEAKKRDGQKGEPERDAKITKIEKPKAKQPKAKQPVSPDKEKAQD